MRPNHVLWVSCVLWAATAGAQAAPTWEGPLPADRSRAVPDETVTGLWWSTQAEAGVWARDPVVGASLSLALEHRWARVRLTAPVTVRVWDVGDKHAMPGPQPLCGVVRCTEWVTDKGGFDPWSLVRVVDEIRLGTEADMASAVVGPQVLRLGRGALVDDVNTAPIWEQRRVGLTLRAHDPWDSVESEAVIADVTAPHTMFGARVRARPARWFMFDDGAGAALLRRAAVSTEVAGDVLADPGQGPTWAGVRLPGPGTRPLVGGRVGAEWPLFPLGGWGQLTPYGSAGVLHGLSRDGAPSWWPGVGAQLGLSGALTLPVVAVSGHLEGLVDSQHHRHGVFSPQYLLDRERALTGQGARWVAMPAPGGLGLRAGMSAAVLRYLRASTRVQLDSAPGGNYVQGRLDVGGAGARVGVQALHRGFVGTLLGGGWSWAGVLTPTAATQVGLEAAVAVWGPFSVYARAARVARPVAALGHWRNDIDVAVGLSSDIVMSSPYLEQF